MLMDKLPPSPVLCLICRASVTKATKVEGNLFFFPSEASVSISAQFILNELHTEGAPPQNLYTC